MNRDLEKIKTWFYNCQDEIWLYETDEFIKMEPIEIKENHFFGPSASYPVVVFNLYFYHNGKREYLSKQVVRRWENLARLKMYHFND